MRSKVYQQLKQSVPASTVDLKTAVGWLKEHARSSFDETVEIHVHLNIDPSKSDQMVRGSVVLPHGTPKQKRVAVFTADKTMQDKAKAAGAAIVGGEELIAAIAEKGSLDADIAVATPDMMPKVAKIARVIGPRGLMPNPKTGTVSAAPDRVVQELVSGKLSFKMDALGNLHEAVGKVSWSAENIMGNIEAFLTAVRAARLPAHRGEFIDTIALKTTMGPSLRITM